MCKRPLLFFVLLSFCAVSLPAQGLETTARQDDWEEINFEFDSSILSDGYPSLLRLADLLSKNRDYHVRLTGHTDFRGSEQYNVGLGQRRAETVRDFLVKYGANENQMSVQTEGEVTPKVPNETAEGRFMNRRVTMYVTDGQGNVVSDGGVGEAIDGLEKLIQAQEECCDKILRRLDKLDEIVDLLNQLKGENDQLKQDIAELQKEHEGVKDQIAQQPEPPSLADIKEAMPKPGKKFSAINLNVGPDTQDGNVSFTGSGRAFIPFAKRHAVQAQGEYLHYFGRDEGQVDLGLVNRWGRFQAGAFSSFKYVKFGEWQSAGGLGQGAVTLDYVFGKGRVGFFGTKSFLDGAVVNTALLQRHLVEETYLKVVDQVGFSTAVAAWNRSWFEGNLGALFRRGGDNRPGGTIRYVHPFTNHLAFTVEAGLNETLVASNNTGRVVFGIQLGNWLNPHDYQMHGEAPVPVDVPRVRYEVLTRQIRTGNDSPVADAGPDQIGIDAGPVTLDGSGSFDPDGDPLTFRWEQTGGPAVSLSGTDTAVATFTAADGETYHFRLVVQDDQGGMGTDRATVSTLSQDVRINTFQITPSTVNRGDTVVIEWEVENATSVNISPMPGDVENAGTSSVTVDETTTFVLTARNGDREVNKKITVTVLQPEVQIVSFTATPQRIGRGETSVLAWNTLNADSVTIEPIGGSFEGGGSTTVSPTETTTYTLRATNQFGAKVATVTVEVLPVPPPRILNFVAAPQEILPGEQSTLSWEVENAETVTITPEIGEVDLIGTSTVSPADTTNYVLTATNEVGTVTATATVTVGKPVRIVSFTANKTVVQNPGDPAVLSWETENAVRVVITGVGEVDPTGSVTVNPTAVTTYTLIAYGRNTETSAVLILKVENENRSPIAIAEAPTAILVPAGTTTGKGQLDGSKSYDPDGDPITFEWRVIGDLEARIVNPSSAKPTVEFLGGFGGYEFELMVSDDKGLMGLDRVKVFWVDP